MATVAIAALALAGCSATTQPPKPTDIAGDITYGFWDPLQQPAMDAIVKAFEKKYPKVHVTDAVTPFTDYWTKLQTEASSSTLPDVFWIDMAHFKLYASNAQLAPIDNLVSSGAIDTSHYPKNLTEFYKLDGKQYGVPKDADTNAMWINKELFKKAGVSLPAPNWSYNDFRKTSAQIHAALGAQGVYGTAFYIYGQTTYYSSVFAYGGSVISPDGKSAEWEKSGAQKGLQIWADLIKDGSAPSVQQLSETRANDWFTSGKAAMFPSIAGASVALIANSPNAADYMAVPLPQGDRKATVIHAISNVVNAKSSNLAAAQAFQAFAASKQAQLLQSESGVSPSAYAGTQNAFVNSHPALDLQVFVDAIKYSYPMPVSLNTDAWAADEPRVVAGAFAGATTVKDATKSLAASMNKALAKK
ncbi:ABC transporter substrate-binding protein [Leifsonia sp. 22587]|uniref:ABC transporter substrate-binding protein n=1 Tax=Leifsonia sp. 22587 TaxID=3453946 RepID=UPI003F862365